MKLDQEFAKEIKRQANGDGSREAKFDFLGKAKVAAKELSTTAVQSRVDEIIKSYGRVAVGMCFAVTIIYRADRLECSTVSWAREVFGLWHNRPRDTGCLIIDDGLHPTRIEEYAGSLIRIITEEQ